MASFKDAKHTNGSDPEYAKRFAGEDNKDKSAFYNEDISPKLTAKVSLQKNDRFWMLAEVAHQTRQILEIYSGIPASEVIAHIHAVVCLPFLD
jgi:hypothetical protein